MLSSEVQQERWTTVAEESFENHSATGLPWGAWDRVPSGWTMQCGGKARVAMVDENYPDSRGGRCLKIEQTGQDEKDRSTAFLGVRLPWRGPRSVEGVRVSFRWKVDADAGGWNFIGSGQYEEKGADFLAGAFVSLRDHRAPVREYLNYLSTLGGGFRRTPCCLLQADAWNETMAIFRPPYNNYTLYVRSLNGDRRIFRDLPFSNGKSGDGLPPNFFMLGAWHYDTRGALWIDDFKVEVLTAQPEGFPQALNPPRPKRIGAAFAASAPVVDGTLDDSVWQHATAVTNFTGWQGSASTRTTRALLAYDTAALYVAFDNRDPAPGT
ncbi:MAG: hypothetical protein PHR35_10665, partial [Kiritimatiellae bacterium]|nr:hypothetical protein [Kiritimatiellia bacterium]